jgi:hypothetical protein
LTYQQNQQSSGPCSFGLISRISSHPAVFFSHNKPANSAFSTINQRNEQAQEPSALGQTQEPSALQGAKWTLLAGTPVTPCISILLISIGQRYISGICVVMMATRRPGA